MLHSGCGRSGCDIGDARLAAGRGSALRGSFPDAAEVLRFPNHAWHGPCAAGSPRSLGGAPPPPPNLHLNQRSLYGRLHVLLLAWRLPMSVFILHLLHSMRPYWQGNMDQDASPWPREEVLFWQLCSSLIIAFLLKCCCHAV